MTLDEAIKHCEEVEEELRNVDMGELDALYCGDTECIEARKNDCIECADEHRQLAEWLKDYKRLLNQQTYNDAINIQVVKDQMIKYGFHAPDMTVTEFAEDLLRRRKGVTHAITN